MKSLAKCKDTMATVVGGFVFVGNQPCMKWVSRYPHPSPIKKWTESISIHTPFPTKNYVSVLLLTPPSALCLPNGIKNLWLSYKAVYSFLWTKYLKQRHIKIIVLTSVKKYPKLNLYFKIEQRFAPSLAQNNKWTKCWYKVIRKHFKKSLNNEYR